MLRAPAWQQFGDNDQLVTHNNVRLSRYTSMAVFLQGGANAVTMAAVLGWWDAY